MNCPIYIKCGSIIPNFPDMSYIGEKEVDTLILDVYLNEMGKVGDEVFGIQYLDDYVNLFPSEDEQAVRDSLTRFAESFHKGHNALPVIILVNKYYIKSWLETGNVKDGYGNLVKL